jgi:hypothetical protein
MLQPFTPKLRSHSPPFASAAAACAFLPNRNPTRFFPPQKLLSPNAPVIAHPRSSIHIFSSGADASAFRLRASPAYRWFMEGERASESEQEQAREGWSAPHGFASVQGLRVDVVSFLRESLATFDAMGAFERGAVAVEDVVTRQQEHSTVWRGVAARSIVWAIGEHSPALSVFHRPAASLPHKRSSLGSGSRSEATAPLLRRTFGFVCVLRCPRLSTLSSLHFEGKWLCPAPFSEHYLAGSSYSPSSAAALDESRGIIASLLPILPAPPQLIRSQHTSCFEPH